MPTTHTVLDTLTFRDATPADAGALADFARRAFDDAFGARNNPADLASFYERTYGPAQQLAEIVHPYITTILVESKGAIVAFTQVKRGDPPACVPLRDAAEVYRFYVDTPWHGTGLAHELMARAIGIAAAWGAAGLWLGVWQENPRGIAFYRKEGFVRVGDGIFIVGTDPQVDDVMMRPL